MKRLLDIFIYICLGVIVALYSLSSFVAYSNNCYGLSVAENGYESIEDYSAAGGRDFSKQVHNLKFIALDSVCLEANRDDSTVISRIRRTTSAQLSAAVTSVRVLYILSSFCESKQMKFKDSYYVFTLKRLRC